MADKELEQLKNILLKDDNARVVDVVRENARTLVSEVLSEALNDREKEDESVAKVLTPIVENSVERSITNHRDKFVSYLYPLVGSLVRKSVAAFLNEFLEKTNKLIENSFTYKGLKWRIKAKQAGVTFAQYVVSQTYVFRVEQVFLIHAETGLLLNSASLDPDGSNDADLISSMLTAINDFIEDSFGKEKRTALDVIKTANFNLVIKDGPFAVIAAAVTGNMSEQVPATLQNALEEIHHLYSEELENFEGDSSTVANSEQQLRDCLITQSRDQTSKVKKKKPWYAIIIVSFLLVLFSVKLFDTFKFDRTLDKLKSLDKTPGIVVRKLTKLGDESYKLSILRDPAVISINEWMQNMKIPLEQIEVSEQLFVSADAEVIQHKIESTLKNYALIGQWKEGSLLLSGEINYSDKMKLGQQLVQFSPNLEVNFDNVTIKSQDVINEENSNLLSELVFKEKVGQISAIQIDFEVAGSVLNNIALAKIQEQTVRLKELFLYAEKVQIKIGVLIVGTSDNTGLQKNNTLISKRRAQIIKSELVKGGIDADHLYDVGIGEIPLPSIASEARKVLFSIIYL